MCKGESVERRDRVREGDRICELEDSSSNFEAEVLVGEDDLNRQTVRLKALAVPFDGLDCLVDHVAARALRKSHQTEVVVLCKQRVMASGLGPE